MTFLFPSFHLPKSRKRDTITATDLEAPKNVTCDFDGSMAVESFVPRKFSVKHMPQLPTFNKKTGHVLRGRRVQSMPMPMPLDFALPTHSTNTSDDCIQKYNTLKEVAPPVPAKEKRYSSYTSKRPVLSLVQRPELLYEAGAPFLKVQPQELRVASSMKNNQNYQNHTKQQKYQDQKYQNHQNQNHQNHQNHQSYQNFLNYYNHQNHNFATRTQTRRRLSAPPVDESTRFDTTTSEISLKQSSTFEKSFQNESNSTLNSHIYKNPELNSSYVNSLLQVYLARDSQNSLSSASSIYSEPNIEEEHKSEKSDENKSFPSQAAKSNPHRAMNVCLDSGAEYDMSRFMIPPAERIISKRFSSAQVPKSYNCFSKPGFNLASNRFSLDAHPENQKEKRASQRWSSIYPQNMRIDLKKNELPEIRVAPRRFSEDQSKPVYESPMKRTLRHTELYDRPSNTEKIPSSRSVSSPIFQIKEILRDKQQ